MDAGGDKRIPERQFSSRNIPKRPGSTIPVSDRPGSWCTTGCIQQLTIRQGKVFSFLQSKGPLRKRGVSGTGMEGRLLVVHALSGECASVTIILPCVILQVP